jgi:hypothetical protein
MERREILLSVGVGSVALVLGCTDTLGNNADKQQSTESDDQSAAGSDEQEGTESEHEGNSEKRADFFFNNKTPSVRQLMMTVTDDSDTVVFQESYQLDSQKEKKTTIPELRNELYNYKFETNSSSATGSFAPDRPTQIRVKVEPGEINIFVVV